MEGLAGPFSPFRKRVDDIGRMLFEAITARDFPIVQAFTIVIAIGYVGANLLVDLSYVLIDPRIKLD